MARLDLKYAIIRPAFDPLGCIGLTLAHPETAPDGTLGRRTAIRVPLSEIVAETGFPSMDEAVMQLTLEPGTPYLLVPSTNGAGVEAPFEVGSDSDHILYDKAWMVVYDRHTCTRAESPETVVEPATHAQLALSLSPVS